MIFGKFKIELQIKRFPSDATWNFISFCHHSLQRSVNCGDKKSFLPAGIVFEKVLTRKTNVKLKK
jgi:hypothetical protein